MQFRSSVFGDFAPDQDLEISGVWIKVGEARFLIRRSGGANKDYDRAIARYSKPYAKDLRRGALDNEIAEQKIILPAFVETVLLAWEGVLDVNGADVPFTREAARELMEALPDVFETLRDYANELATFRRQDIEETADRLGES